MVASGAFAFRISPRSYGYSPVLIDRPEWSVWFMAKVVVNHYAGDSDEPARRAPFLARQTFRLEDETGPLNAISGRLPFDT